MAKTPLDPKDSEENTVPTMGGGPWNITRLPLRGYLITGGSKIASYRETWVEAKAELLQNIVTYYSAAWEEENRLVVAPLLELVFMSYRHWEETNPKTYKEFTSDKYPKLVVMRTDGAFLVNYGDGLLVCKDLGELGIAIDLFNFERRIESPKEAPNRQNGKFTQEELENFLREASRAAAVPVSPDPEEGPQP